METAHDMKGNPNEIEREGNFFEKILSLIRPRADDVRDRMIKIALVELLTEAFK